MCCKTSQDTASKDCWLLDWSADKFEGDPMNKFRRLVMWAALALIILLIFLSIYGAFLGPDHAKNFFNSLPLTVYWLALALLLIVAIVVFRRLLRVPALLLIHSGCILVLAGAIWGSDVGHNLQRQFFGIDKIAGGRMVIFEGHSENQVVLENDKQTRELPFYIKLRDFRLEHYKPEYLHVQTRQGRAWRIPVKIGSEFSLDPDFGTVTVVKTFRNFKLTVDGDKRIAIDDPKPGSNPALEVQIKDPDGATTTKYVFERFPGHIHPEDKFLLSYQRIIRDYISELQVIIDTKVLAEKNIEVNHPLHFGGYHFYQHSYDGQAGQYTVLQVVSDTGLAPVYAGYLMLCAGVFWHFWLRHIFTKIKLKSE
ncbi:hypothetical protein ES703_31803 [subsurface metagenome]